MRRISRKADGDPGIGIGTVVSLIFGAIILVIGFGIYLYAQKYGTDVLTMISDFTKDYDNDGLPNGIDPCSCGSPPNMNNEVITIDGIKYCTSGFSETTCKQLIDKYKDYPNSFMWKPIDRYGSKNMCIYSSDGCFRLRLDSYKTISNAQGT